MFLHRLSHAAAASRRIPGAITVCAMLLAGPSLSGNAVSAADQPPATSEPIPPNAPVWHWRLAGTLLGPDHRGAVFAQTDDARTGETRAVEQGEQIDGWTLSEIRKRGVTLTAAGRERTLSMEGLSPEEQAAADRLIARENARRNETVRANLARQERGIEEGSATLLEATRKMQASRPQ
jgi:hypothetical protein